MSIEQRTIRKVSLRIIPFVALIFFFSFLDRINVSFAALTMNKDVGISATAYGFAASIFYWGYLAFEVPSNLALSKIGPRIWIARIMITWGLATVLTAFVWNEHSFYAVRFLLGVAEAGSFPALVVYLMRWLPAEHRGKALGMFIISIPLSIVIGAPLSTYILQQFDLVGGLAGWKWLFVLQGGPTILLGIACLWLIKDRVQEVKWLTQEEKDWLEATLERERIAKESEQRFTVWQALTNGRVLALSLGFLCLNTGVNGTGFWIPQIVREFGLSTREVGFVTAAPYLLAAIAMFFWTRLSDRASHRLWFVVLPPILAAIGFAIAGANLSHPLVAVVSLSIAVVGIFCALPVFWTFPPSFLTGAAAAGAIALINTIGNSNGLFVPALIGWSRDKTGGFQTAIFGLGVVLLLGALIFYLAVPRKRTTSALPDAAGGQIPQSS